MRKALVQILVDHYIVVEHQIPICKRWGFNVGIELSDGFFDLLVVDEDHITFDVFLRQDESAGMTEKTLGPGVKLHS
jgi:hypothetical protein